MAHFHGTLGELKVSTDGGATWTDLGIHMIGSIYIETEGIESLVEITPDNPMYAELVKILENPLPYVRW